MSIPLLDVNLLISLLDSAHAHHDAAVKWFRRSAAKDGWATCAITENGFVRIVSHRSYPNLRLTPGRAAESLARFKGAFAGIHRFWKDEISVTDTGLFDLALLAGPRQITDTYLAGLAHQNGGRFATLEGNVQWKAVRGADARLIERITP